MSTALEAQEADAVVPAVVIHSPVVGAQINAVTFHERRSGALYSGTGGHRHDVSHMPLKVLVGTVDGVEANARGEPYLKVAV